MTDVLILKKIAGAKPGKILPLDDRLRDHVRAGNAQIRPAASEAFGSIEEPAPEPEPSVLNLTGTGHDAELHEDEDTSDYGDPED